MVFEPTLKVKVPVASRVAPVSMSTSMVLLTVPEDGGIWGKVIRALLKTGEQKP